VTLRLVRDERPGRPPGRRREPLFNPDQERCLRAALKTLRGSFGSWRAFGAAMGVDGGPVERAANGRSRISAELAIRASRAARQPLESLLSPGPRPSK
jgi:hypothetical protein